MYIDIIVFIDACSLFTHWSRTSDESKVLKKEALVYQKVELIMTAFKRQLSTNL